MPTLRGLRLPARLREKVAGLGGRDAQLDRVLSWIRTIALEEDSFVLELPGGRDVLRFAHPSLPGARPVRVDGDVARARFVVRSRPGGGDATRRDEPPGPGWRAVVRLRDLQVFERDLPHGPARPLRLGLAEHEASAALDHARRCAEHRAGGSSAALPGILPSDELARLSLRCRVAVAVWCRGRLRGSVVSPAGPALRALGNAAAWACADSRFEAIGPQDLRDSVLQVSLVHAPAVPLEHGDLERADAYHDKALFLSEGTRAGVFLPEVYNLAAPRRLAPLADRLAREKAGLEKLGPGASLEVCEVTEFIESASRSRPLRLDGPVAFPPDDGVSPRDRARAAGEAATRWLATIQALDGALPLRVHPHSGVAEGIDRARTAMTAHAACAFGVAHGVDEAVDVGRRALAWVGRTGVVETEDQARAVLTACYAGKGALVLGELSAADARATEVLRRIERARRGLSPLVHAHVASFLRCVADRRADAAVRCEATARELEARFAGARAAGSPMSLAEWAEVALASPASTSLARDVRQWLSAQQLPTGAFPDTTASGFVYSRGTGKVFEVLASGPPGAEAAATQALGWLLAMQYRPDSAFFVPVEHRARVLGGLRHDYFDADAWIDAAGHLLLGLARLVTP